MSAQREPYPWSATKAARSGFLRCIQLEVLSLRANVLLTSASCDVFKGAHAQGAPYRSHRVPERCAGIGWVGTPTSRARHAPAPFQLRRRKVQEDHFCSIASSTSCPFVPLCCWHLQNVTFSQRAHAQANEAAAGTGTGPCFSLRGFSWRGRRTVPCPDVGALLPLLSPELSRPIGRAAGPGSQTLKLGL
jgi:hypothetical protein